MPSKEEHLNDQQLAVITYLTIILFFLLIGIIIKQFGKNKFFGFKLDYDKMVQNTSVDHNFGNYNLENRDVLNVVYTLQINGTNRYDNRWTIKNEINEDFMFIFEQNHYLNFNKKFNKIAKWSSLYTFFLRILAMLYFPLYEKVSDYFRKKKIKKLIILIQNYGQRIFNLKQPNRFIMKYQISQDNTLLNLHIIDIKTEHYKYLNLSQPFITILSGYGNFTYPLKIDVTDHIFQSILFKINKKQDKLFRHLDLFHIKDTMNQDDANNRKFEQFINQFNKYAALIDFTSSSTSFIKNFKKLLQAVDKFNQLNLNIRLDIVILEIPKLSYKFQSEAIFTMIDASRLENHRRDAFLLRIQEMKVYYSFHDVKIGIMMSDLDQNFIDLSDIQGNQLNNHFFNYEIFDEYDQKQSEKNSSRRISDKLSIVGLKDQYKSNNFDDDESKKITQFEQLFSKEKLDYPIKFIKWVRRYLTLYKSLFVSFDEMNDQNKNITRITFVFFLIQDLTWFYWLLISNYQQDIQIWSQIFPYPFSLVLSNIFGLVWVIAYLILKITSSNYNIGRQFLMMNFLSQFNIIFQIIFENTIRKQQYMYNVAHILYFFNKFSLAFVGQYLIIQQIPQFKLVKQQNQI